MKGSSVTQVLECGGEILVLAAFRMTAPNAKAITPKIGNQMTDAPNVGES